MEVEAKSESGVELSIEPDLMEFIDVESNVMQVDEKDQYDVEPELMAIDEKEESSDLVFVDIQGFRDSKGRFICKEFCLVSGDDVHHAIIKSPFRFAKLPGYYKNQAFYNTRYVHGLTWECGDVHLIDFLQIVYMKIMGKIVVVKGDQKVRWLKYLFRNCGEIECANMEDWGYCKSIHKSIQVHENCDYHFNITSQNWKLRCAKENALQLQEIVTKYELDVNYF